MKKLLLLVIVTISFPAFGEIDWESVGRTHSRQKYRSSCRGAAELYAKRAFNFSNYYKAIIETPSAGKSDFDNFRKLTNDFLEQARRDTARYRQSDSPDDIVFGAAYHLSAGLAVEAAVKFTGRTEDWYQDYIFENCVSPNK
jgi:hypothetical protein